MGGVGKGTSFIRERGNFRNLFACTPRRISWKFFAIVSEIQKKTVKMGNHQRLVDGMIGEIARRLETGKCQVQILKDVNLTPSVVSNL